MFTKDFYAFIADQFGHQEHAFLTGISTHKNFQHSGSNLPKVHSGLSWDAVRAARRADAIVIHGLISPNVLLFFFLQPWLLRKSNWLIFGGDIYGVQRNLTGVSKFLRAVIERIRKRMYPRIGFITVVSGEDYVYAQRHYGVTAPCFKVTYPVAATAVIGELEETLKSRSRNKQRPIRIQVGNSATDTNGHFAVFDALAQYRDEEIRLFLPLNYGSGNYQGYADRVVAYARDIFGDKVEPLREQVQGDEYLKMLASVDVGIFNNDRQQATGNISQLALTGAKIYMRPEVSMWKHFSELGCRFADIAEIREASFAEFVDYPYEVREINASVIRRRHSIDTKITQWTTVFDSMQEALGFQERSVESRSDTHG
jgi:dTDP-N-acetylfucosamine:lipid II N-acetylfucosaminyltransferase